MKNPIHSSLTRRTLMLAAASLALVPAALAQGTKPKIGFIGAGRVGGLLAKFWTKAGYQVMLSARDLGPVKELAAQLGPNAHVGTSAEAAAWGDVVVVTVPYGALPQVGRDYAAQLQGKVVLDTCNPSLKRDGDMAKDGLEKGTGVVDQTYLPGVRLVRAFNAITVQAMDDGANRPGERIGVALAADDAKALAVAKQLVIDAGFEPVVTGGLATAKSFDTGTAVYPKAIPAGQLKQMLGVK